MAGTDEDQYEWTVFKFPAAKATLECKVFSRNGKERKGRLCYNPFQCSSGSTFHWLCFWESIGPATSRDLHLKHIWRFALWARPWKTAPSLDDFEASQPVIYEPTKDEVERARANDDLLFLWKLCKLPLEIQQEIMTMAYGSLLWRIFAARKWRKRLSGLSGDSVTLLITDVKCWKRGKQLKPNLTEPNLMEGIVTIAIDNLGIRSLKVSDSWPSPTSNQAKNHAVYIVEQISNLRGLYLKQQVFKFIICLVTKLIVH